MNGWAGLMIDLIESQVISEIPLANELREKLEPHNVKLAIDDFGRGHASLMKLKELPFAEMKLDRSFVVDCGTNKVNAPICSVITWRTASTAWRWYRPRPPTCWRWSAAAPGRFRRNRFRRSACYAAAAARHRTGDARRWHHRIGAHAG